MDGNQAGPGVMRWVKITGPEDMPKLTSEYSGRRFSAQVLVAFRSAIARTGRELNITGAVPGTPEPAASSQMEDDHGSC